MCRKSLVRIFFLQKNFKLQIFLSLFFVENYKANCRAKFLFLEEVTKSIPNWNFFAITNYLELIRRRIHIYLVDSYVLPVHALIKYFHFLVQRRYTNFKFYILHITNRGALFCKPIGKISRPFFRRAFFFSLRNMHSTYVIRFEKRLIKIIMLNRMFEM